MSIIKHQMFHRVALFTLILVAFSLFLPPPRIAHATTINLQVSTGNDDAEEDVSDGSIDRGSGDLELVVDGSTDQEVGMRFQNVTIPQGETINSAFIQFTVDETDSGTTNLTFYGEDVDDAPTFTTSISDITNRTKTSASVAWNSVPVWDTVGAAGPDQKTPNLASIIQEIINRAGWVSGNDIVIIVDGTGERTAESYNGSSSLAPKLDITYGEAPDTTAPADVTNLAASNPTITSINLSWTAPGDDGSTGTASSYDIRYSTASITEGNWASSTQATGEPSPQIAGSSESFTVTGLSSGTIYYFALKTSDEIPNTSGISNVPTGTTVSFEVQISTGNDDAEEDVSDGSIDRGSGDLELVVDGSTDQEVGMRFQNIPISQGAIINSAFIQFAVDETDSGTTNLIFYGEDIDDAPTFLTSNSNITNRTKTSASVAWNSVPVWDTVGAAGPDQKTPNLASIIQEIVNRAGWVSGNDIVIIVDGTGERTAESYNGSTSLAPKLEVTYSTPLPPPPLAPRTGGRPIAVVFSGQAYPESEIEILRKYSEEEKYKAISKLYRRIGQEKFLVDEEGKFELSLGGLVSEAYLFTIRAIDKDGRKTGIRAFNVDLKSEDRLEVRDILFPPTLGFQESRVKEGGTVTIMGYAAPESMIEVDIGDIALITAQADESGFWKTEVDISPLQLGGYSVRARQITPSGSVSDFSVAQTFYISSLAFPQADLNNDEEIDITDWNIFLFQWGSEKQTPRLEIDLDNNGVIDIFDFNIFLGVMQN